MFGRTRTDWSCDVEDIERGEQLGGSSPLLRGFLGEVGGVDIVS